MNKEELKKYLGDVLELEKQKFELQRILQKLQDTEYCAAVSNVNDITEKDYFGGMGCGFIIGAIALSVIFGGTLEWFGVILGGILGAGIVFFINKIENDAKTRKEIAEKQRIETENVRLISLAEQRKTIMEVSQNEVSNSLGIVQATLEKMYLLGIIYPKYHNIIALSSIYEYIDSGRCDKLEGHDGAYNTYELEVRLDKIITKMDVIISKLDQIMTNQYYLYVAIKELQPKIDEIADAIIKNTEKLDEIAVNTKITAYTTQVIEKNQYYDRKWGNGRLYDDRINMPKI